MRICQTRIGYKTVLKGEIIVRKILLLFGIIFVFTACSNKPNDITTQDENRVQIIVEDELNDELRESSLFTEALEKKSVIIYNGKPVSDYSAAENFLKSVEEKTDNELYIYSFSNWDWSENTDCFVQRFSCKDGKITEITDFILNWNTQPNFEYEYEVERITLNEYGYLVYKSESSSEEEGIRVVRKEEVFKNAKENEELYDKYVRPILWSAALQEWDSPQRIDGIMWVYEDIFNYENNGKVDLWDKYGCDWPLEDIASTLGKYFDITKDEIIHMMDTGESWGGLYNSETDTVFYRGGRGGAGLCVRVTDCEKDGDMLKLKHEQFRYWSGEPYNETQTVLTVKLLGDGSFHYLSNIKPSTGLSD